MISTKAADVILALVFSCWLISTQVVWAWDPSTTVTFTSVATASGLDFEHTDGRSGRRLFNEFLGSGGGFFVTTMTTTWISTWSMPVHSFPPNQEGYLVTLYIATMGMGRLLMSPVPPVLVIPDMGLAVQWATTTMMGMLIYM